MMVVIWVRPTGLSPGPVAPASAAAFPEARFEQIPKAGHLPHIEQQAATFAIIDDYLRGRS